MIESVRVISPIPKSYGCIISEVVEETTEIKVLIKRLITKEKQTFFMFI